MHDADADPTAPEPTPAPLWREPLESLSVSLSRDIEQLVGDLRTRWERGDRVPIETLGELFQRIAAHEEQLLDAIYHEVLLREEFGERPELADYTARFPQHAARLERLFAVHSAIESDWEDDPEDAAVEGRAPPHPSSTEWQLSPGSPDGSRRRRRRRTPVDAPPGYELLDELGRGGMAVVFRARQQNLDRIVALKMILGGAITSPDVLIRFEQEARTVAQLQHPGIVQIHEVGEHRGLPYLSLEYVPGGTLHDWLRGRPLPAAEAARLIEQLARTTQFAHERGVVHRDLKPANLLLTQKPSDSSFEATVMSDSSQSGDGSRDPQVHIKIADFGLARLLGSAHSLTVTGQVIGTPSYMAPEQARAMGDGVHPTLDVYSLGAILYELLTGHPPFRGATLLDTLAQVRNDEPVSPRRLQPGVPRDLETICLKCLEKAPERRYATAAALADDLQRFLNGEAISARPVMLAERMWKWARRSPALAALTTVTAASALLGVVGLLEGMRRATASARDARLDRDQAVRLRIVADRERENAERERAQAEAARAEAERQQRAAEEEKQRALTARTEAEASFRSALEAVTALSHFGRQLRLEPRQQATSGRIIEETLRFYEGFLTQRPENPILRLMAAMALIEAGDLRNSMGDGDKARELLDRAVEYIDGLLASHPDHLGCHAGRAKALWLRGHVFRRLEKWDDAERDYLACIAHHDHLLARRADDPAALVQKANAIVNLCVVLQRTNRFRQSLEQYAAAAEILRQLTQRHPADEYYRSELALCLDDYGKQLWNFGRRSDAEPLLREALAARETLYDRRPNEPGVRTLLTRSLVAVARCEAHARRLEAADEMLARGAALLEPLLEDYPDIYEYYSELYWVYFEQLRVAVQRKGLLGIDPEWQRMLGLLQRAHQQFPQDPFFTDRYTQSNLRYAFLVWETPEAHGLLESARDLFRPPAPKADLP